MAILEKDNRGQGEKRDKKKLTTNTKNKRSKKQIGEHPIFVKILSRQETKTFYHSQFPIPKKRSTIGNIKTEMLPQIVSLHSQRYLKFWLILKLKCT